MTRTIFIIMLMMLFSAVIISTAAADTIILKNGGRMRGKIIEENEKEVVIKVANAGTITVRMSKIEEIRRDRTPEPKPAEKEEIPQNLPVPRREEQPGHKKPSQKAKETPESMPSGPVSKIIERYAKSLKSRGAVEIDTMEKYEKELLNLGTKATADLSIALKFSKDWRVRYLVVETFRDLKDPASIPALIYAFGDEFLGDFTLYDRHGNLNKDYRIRRIAAYAIEDIGDKGYRAVLRHARDKNSKFHEKAVWGMRYLERPGIDTALIEIAKDKSCSDTTRKYAVEGLYKKGKKAHKALVELLADKIVRQEASTALKKTKDKSLITSLMAHVRKAKSDYELALHAAQIIYRTDDDYRPERLEDYVDYMLLARALSVKSRIGDKAIPRLNYWLKEGPEEIKKRAKSAMSQFKK